VCVVSGTPTRLLGTRHLFQPFAKEIQKEAGVPTEWNAY
jgi:hypothetical protein